MSTLKLLTDSILQVPFANYEKDFTFVVNGEEFHTNKIVADLLSTKISKSHLIDPTMNQIVINTHAQGNFQHFIDLITFEEQFVREEELPFISEIFEQLDPEKVKVNFEISSTELTIYNVFNKICRHEMKRSLYYFI